MINVTDAMFKALSAASRHQNNRPTKFTYKWKMFAFNIVFNCNSAKHVITNAHLRLSNVTVKHRPACLLASFINDNKTYTKASD